MNSYLGQKLDKQFQKAIKAGKELADLFIEGCENYGEDSADNFILYIEQQFDEDNYNKCLEMAILPQEIIENEIGLKIIKWSGGDVELKWSGK